jgi:hypothetical protein
MNEELPTVDSMLKFKEGEEPTDAEVCAINEIKCKTHGFGCVSISRSDFILICIKCYKEGKTQYEFEFENGNVPSFIDSKTLLTSGSNIIPFQLPTNNQLQQNESTSTNLMHNPLSASTPNFSAHLPPSSLTIPTNQPQLPLSSSMSNLTPSQMTPRQSITIDCYYHPSYKGIFYCDTCKQFICENCFANEHRTHRSNLPHQITSQFKEYISNTISQVNILKPTIEETLENIKQIYTRLKQQKDSTLKSPENAIQTITANHKSQLAMFNDTLQSKFNNLDKDISDNFQKHSQLKEKTSKLIQEFDDNYLKTLSTNNTSLSPIDICLYHQQHVSKFKNTIDYIKSSLNFINNKMQNTLTSCESAKTNIDNELSLLNKSLSTYENCTTSSILTGQASYSYLLRRFIKFIHSDIKFFKITSIIMNVNVPVFMTGVSLCGIYVSNKKMNDPDYIAESMNRESLLQKAMNIRVSVYEVNNSNDVLIQEDSQLCEILDSNDPSHVITFSKGVRINPDKDYVLMIENLSDVSYCDLWVGGTIKPKGNDAQVIKCHNTNTEFVFKQTKQIQSDFDEFNIGIIEGVLYARV